MPDSVPKNAFILAKKLGVIVASTERLSELEEVFKRVKFEKYVRLDDRILAIEEYKLSIEFIEPTEIITVCSDPKDNKFLELAVACQASCIISGDPHLLNLNPFRNIPIMNSSDFLNSFNSL